MKAVIITFDEKTNVNNDVLAQVLGKAVMPMTKPRSVVNICCSSNSRDVEIVKKLLLEHEISHSTNSVQKEAVKHAVVYISTLAKDELESLNMIRIAVALSKLYREDENARLAIEVILTNKELLRTVSVKLHHLNHPKVLGLLQDIVNFYKDV